MELETHDSGPGLGDSKERERTPEELAMIHAAMLEELGIGRMDTLPLEDRGHKGYVPNTNTQRLNPPANEAISRWQNLEFDDVDDAFEQLDTIADGQLYRLRQGVPTGPSHRAAGKGDHHSLSNSKRENGGSATRGGRGGQSVGVGRGRGSSNGSRSTRSINAHFNEASRGPSKHARIEATIAHLRAPPRSRASPSKGRHQSISMPVNTKPTNRPVTRSHFAATLASPDDFLAATGFTLRIPPTSAIEQTLPNAGNVLESESSKPAGTSVSRILAQTGPSVSVLPGANESPTAGLASGQIGLQGSRWATPAATSQPSTVAASSVIQMDSAASFQVTPAAGGGTLTTSPPVVSTPVVLGNEITTAARSLLATTSISVFPSRDILKECKIKLARKNGKTWGPEKMGVLRIVNQNHTALEIEVGNTIVLKTSISDRLTWQVSGSIVIFNTGSEVFQVTFRLPHELHSFTTLLPLELEQVSSPTRDQQALPANAATTQIEAPISTSTPDIIAAPVTIPPTISSATLNEISSLASVPPLIDLSDDIHQEVSTQPWSGSAAEDLAVFADDSTLEGILQPLDYHHSGSILEDISSNVAEFPDGAIFLMADNLVEGRLRGSECFAMSPDSLAATWTLEKTREVLEKAQSQAQASPSVTQSGPVVQGCDAPCSSSEIPKSRTVINIAEASNTAVTEAKAVVDYKSSPVLLSGARRYPVVELLSYQSQASIIKGELLPQRELYGILPYQLPRTSCAEFAAKFASQSTRLGSQEDGDSKTLRKQLTPQRRLPLSQCPSETKTANASSQYQPTDPALWGVLLSSVGQKKPDESPQVPSRGIRHRPKTSEWDVRRLTRSFEDLKIAASRKSSVASQAAKYANLTPDACVTTSPQSPTSALSLPTGFNAGQNITLNQLPEETGPTSILKVSNKREAVAKAKLPGLSSSKWAVQGESPSFTPKPRTERVSTPPSVIQTQQPVEQRLPVVHTFLVPDPKTGRFVEARGILKTDCDQLGPENAGSTTRLLENISFQNMASSPLTPSFPYRSSMFHSQLFDACSPSDFKPDAPIFKPASRASSDRGHLDNSTSVPASRPALSPIRHGNVQAALQTRLDRSIAQRHGSSPRSRN